MSTKKRLQSLYIILGLLVALAAFVFSDGLWYLDTHTPLAQEEAESLEIEENPAMENPAGRLEYEREMLADPATGEVPLNIRLMEMKYANEVLAEAASIKGVSSDNFGKEAPEGAENSSFVSYGPYNIGGRTRGLALDVTDENIIIAGGVSGGIWRSTDAGASWTKTSSPTDFPPVTALIQDTRDGHTSDWYFGGGEFFGNSGAQPGAFYFGDGIYRSTDGGQSWEVVPATTIGNNVELGPYTIVTELAIDPSNAEEAEIYVGGLSRLIRATDNFQNAATVLGGSNTGFNFTDVVVSNTGIVYASIANSDPNGPGAEEGIFTSENGIAWTDITPPTGLPDVYERIELTLDPQDENILYAIGGVQEGGSTTDFLMQYNRDTDTWVNLSGNLGSSTDIGEGHHIQMGYNLYVRVHPGDQNTLFVGGTNILRSTDVFGTAANRDHIGGYQPDNNPNSFASYLGHHPDQHSAVFLPSNPNVMITGNDGGIYRTENNMGDNSGPNPVVWTDLNNGYITSQFYTIDYLRDTRGDRRIPGGMQDNGSWINYTNEPDGAWTKELGGDGSYAAITYNSLYLSAQEGQMRRYQINGNTGEFDIVANVSPSNSTDEFLFVNPFIANPVNQDQLFVGAQSRVYYTDDIRQNPGPGQWQSFTGAGLSGDRVSVLAASIQPSGVLYFGTRGGSVYKVDDTQNITQATVITGSNMPNDAVVSGIAIDPRNADRAIVTFSNYRVVSIFMTEDGGSTWTSIGGNLEEDPDGSGNGPSVRWVEILPAAGDNNLIFVGTSVGLYMTDNPDGDNTTWVAQSDNQVGRNLVTMMRVRPNEGQVVAATHGNGVFIGTYDVPNTPTINYSVVTPNEEILLRGPVSTVSGAGFTYQWVKNGENIEGATSSTFTVTDGGTFKLRLTDESDQSTTESNELVFTLDNTPPTIESVFRLDPQQEEIEVTEVTFQVSFDEAVNNVDAADFETTGDVSGTVASVTPIQNNLVFDVVVNGIGGQGTLGLGVSSSNNITDIAGNAFSGTITTAETYTVIDQVIPTVAISRSNPTTEVTNQVNLTFSVVFSEAVSNVDAADFELSSGSVATGSIESVSQGASAAVYSVIVSGITEDGLVDIDFAAGQDIQDLAGNAFAGDITSEETFTIEDNVITSIDDPAAGPSQVRVKTNPSEGLFTLTLSDAYLRGFELRIINGNGKEVLATEKDRYEPESEVQLDLSNLPDGLYLLNVAGEERKDVVKLLKQKN